MHSGLKAGSRMATQGFHCCLYTQLLLIFLKIIYLKFYMSVSPALFLLFNLNVIFWTSMEIKNVFLHGKS